MKNEKGDKNENLVYSLESYSGVSGFLVFYAVYN
jgi:hypothetical protein